MPLSQMGQDADWAVDNRRYGVDAVRPGHELHRVAAHRSGSRCRSEFPYTGHPRSGCSTTRRRRAVLLGAASWPSIHSI